MPNYCYFCAWRFTKKHITMNRQFTIKLITAISAILFIGGCGKWYKDEELVLEKQPYTGNALRLDGYYYNRLDNGRILDTYFFYRDGTLLYGIETDSLDNDLDKYDVWFTDKEFLDFIKKHKYRWGLFQIHGNSMYFERWVDSDGGYPVGRFVCNILNDTTFFISTLEYPHSGEAYPQNHLFHFHAFSPKPDSTNIFVP